MSVRHQITHKENIGSVEVTYRADIEDSAFSGTATDHLAGDVFFDWEYDQLDERDPFSNPVQKSSFTANLLIQNETDLILLNDILDADEDRFKIHFYIDGVHKWSGKVLTDLIEYPEGPYPFTARITAKDLSNLEGVDYDFVSTTTYERLSVIIAECLQNTSLILPIRSYTNLTNLDISDKGQDFLYALYHQKYALRNRETPLNCLEVLETICRAYNLLIRQADGRWVIEQLPAVAKGDDVQFDYNANGLNPVSSTPSRTVTIDRNSSFLLPTSQNKVTGALKTITSHYKHRTLILNIDVEDVTLNTPNDPRGTFSHDFDNTGGYYVHVSGDVEAEISGSFDVLVGTAYYQVRGIRPGESTLYLNSSGNFTQTETDLEVSLYGQDGNTISGSFSIQAGEIHLAVSTIVIDFGWADIVSDDLSVNNVTFSNTNAYLFNVDDRDWEATLGYKYNRSGNYSVTEEIPETLLGDGPMSGTNFASRGRPSTSSSVGGAIDPGRFLLRSEAQSVTLEELVLRERVSMRRNALRNIRASLWMNYSPENLIEYDGKKWFFLGGRFQAKSSRWDANILLLDYAREAGDVFQSFVEEGGDPSGSSGSGSGGSSGSGISLEQADSRYLQIANDLSEVDAASARANLGLGDLATQNTINNSDWSGADLAIAHGGTGASSASAARANLGLEIGSDVQAHSPVLDGLASGLTATAAELNRLDGDLATVRGNLGLGTTDDVQFRDLTARNLELTGVINYVNEENLYVEDKTITLNRGGTNASSESAGLIIERPGGNQSLLWNSTDGFEFSDRIKASGASFGELEADRVTAQMYEPITLNTGNDIKFYHLGTLDGYSSGGNRVKIEIVGQNSYGDEFNNITIGSVFAGNADEEFGAWQYTIGDSNFGNPRIIYKPVDGTRAGGVDVYLRAGTYFLGSVHIQQGNGFRLSSDPTAEVSDPSGTEAVDEYILRSKGYFVGGGAFGITSFSGSETLRVAGSSLFDDNIVQSSGTIGTDNFTSGFTGAGWQATYEGDITAGNLLLRESLRARELIFDQLGVIGGSQLISPARGKIESVNTGTSQVTLEDPNGRDATTFQVDDIFWIQAWDIDGASIVSATGTVTAVSTTTLTLSFSSGAIGDLSPGDVIVQRGSTSNASRQSLIYQTASDADAPFTAYYSAVDAVADFAPSNVITQVGNLDNLNTLYGISGDGLFGSRAFLTGSILIGDLTKAGTYLEYASGDLNAVLDTLNITIDAGNSIVADATGVDINATAFALDAGGTMEITSGIGIDVGTDFWHNDGTFQFGGGILTGDGSSLGISATNVNIGETSGWFGASDVLAYNSDGSVDIAGFSASSTQLIHDFGGTPKVVMGDTTGTGFWGFGITKTGGFSSTDSFVRMRMNEDGSVWGFQAYNDGDEIMNLGSDPRISNLTIAGALTMGDTGSILLPSRGIIEGQNSLDDPLWRLEWRGLHLDTSAELEWFSDHALGVNSKSVAFIQASGDGGTSATNNQLVLRTAGSNSSILMTTGILDINASVHFTGGALRGAEFFNDATFQNAAIFEPMVINSSTPPSTGWKVGTSSVTGDLVAVHSSGTFRVLASN